MNKLIREDNSMTQQTIGYVYDAGGNLLEKRIFAYLPDKTIYGLEKITPSDTVSYTYDSTFKDKLVSYDGEAITYDAIGNPLSYRGMTFTWKKGRELNQVQKDNKTYTYRYDANGMRNRKYLEDGTVIYQLEGTSIVGEQKLTNAGNLAYEMEFIYDSTGNIVAFLYNGDEYYYIKNLQGDIVGILNSQGTEVVSYQYDSWGKLLEMEGDQTLGNVNPFRYRGYYYDAETGFYYVSSRYYDPEVGRFLSPDSAISGVGGDIRGYNMYSYCFNNPVNMSDPTGDWPKWVETVAKVVSVVAVGAAVAVTVAAVSAFTAGTGSAAAVYGASIFLGAALSGVNGAVANSKKGNSYANGYVGGFTGGSIQAACSKSPGGVIVGGGVGVTVGTAITDSLNNLDPDSQNSTKAQMLKNATTSGLKALVTSSVTAYAGYSADLAKLDGAGGLMPSFTYGFAEGLKAFFGWADDAVIYVWE